MDKIFNINNPLEIKTTSPALPFFSPKFKEESNPTSFKVNIVVPNSNIINVKSEVSSFGVMFFQWGGLSQSL